MSGPRHRLRVAAGLGALALLSGCVGMPTGGPVEESTVDPATHDAPGGSYDPLPPQPGQSPAEIVSGFLEAMQATPIGTGVAQQFLTAEAQDTWDPEDRILTYAELEPPSGQTAVSTELTDVDHYDERGAWVRSEEAERLDFVLTTEDGEWRIARAPDALVVPDSWFDKWYQRVSLYYLDPAAEILVPEPVFVPTGDQLASLLVRGLLTPPAGREAGVVRTYFPSGTQPGLSVPVKTGGIAQVSLSGDPDTVDEDTAARMRAQLVWTLRQDVRVNAVELRVGDRAFGTAGGLTPVNDPGVAAYDPTGAGATDDLFALQDGLLVSGTLGSLAPTLGPLGRQDLGVRTFGVNVSGTSVAAVLGGGTSLVLAPVDRPDGAPVEVLGGADDLRAPVWDHRDRAWVVDRAGGRARIFVVEQDAATEVVVRGMTGRDVTEVLVSRDGTRLVAVVRGRERDQVVAARILHRVDGRLRRVLSARPLALPDDSGRVRDVAWRTPTAVSVLSSTNADLSEIRTVSVDGAPGEITTEGPTRQRGPTSSLVSSPVEGAGVYAVSGREVTDLRTPELDLPDLPRRLRALSYAG